MVPLHPIVMVSVYIRSWLVNSVNPLDACIMLFADDPDWCIFVPRTLKGWQDDWCLGSGRWTSLQPVLRTDLDFAHLSFDYIACHNNNNIIVRIMSYSCWSPPFFLVPGISDNKQFDIARLWRNAFGMTAFSSCTQLVSKTYFWNHWNLLSAPVSINTSTINWNKTSKTSTRKSSTDDLLGSAPYDKNEVLTKKDWLPLSRNIPNM